jgi:hypothetical protein
VEFATAHIPIYIIFMEYRGAMYANTLCTDDQPPSCHACSQSDLYRELLDYQVSAVCGKKAYEWPHEEKNWLSYVYNLGILHT